VSLERLQADAERGWRWWDGLAPKLLGAVALVIALLAIILSLLATNQLKGELARSFESKGEAIALAMATAAEQSIEADPALVQAAVDANKVIFAVKYIYVMDERGRPKVHTFTPVFPRELAGVNRVALGEVFGAGRRVKIVEDVVFHDAQGEEHAIDVAAPVAAGALGVVHVGMDAGEIERQTETLRAQMLSLACLVAAAGVLACFGLVHALVIRPVRELTRVTREIVAEGDLTHVIGAQSRDEVGQLAMTFSAMVQRLRTVLLTVTDLVESVAEVSRRLADTGATVSSGSSTVLARVEETSSSMRDTFTSLRGVEQSVAKLHESAERASSTVVEIAKTNERVEENVESMSRSVEEVGAAVDHMATSMQDIAQDIDRLKASVDATGSAIGELDAATGEIEMSAEQTARLSDLVSSDARVGFDALERTLAGLRRIQESSSATLSVIESLGGRVADIGSVVDVISTVAEQTNLLALNASIIAAQAGEPGAGFAIVADNVKELARRTANSTVEIAELIADVQAQSRDAVEAMTVGARNVGEGVRLGDETAKALRKILETATKSTAMSNAIAKATVEQTRGSKHINGSIQHIAGAVERIAAASNDQAVRSQQIMKSTATMRSLTLQVRRSSHEQAEGSKHAIKSIEQINDMASLVNRAQKQQTERTAPVLSALETIRGTSEGQNQSMAELEDSIRALQRESEILRGEVKRFRLGRRGLGQT